MFSPWCRLVVFFVFDRLFYPASEAPAKPTFEQMGLASFRIAPFGTGRAMLGLWTAGASCVLPHAEREDDMTESVYKVIELIGTSKESWEKAAGAAINRAGKTLRDLRVAEIAQLDLQLDAKGQVEAYRAKVKVSFKFED
jgi:flavin-binding protein dodecin